MAYDFLGTLSLEQLNDLQAFLEGEIENIDDQINTLLVDIDNSKRTLQELVAADNSFGGDALNSIEQTQLPLLVNIPDQNDANSGKLVEQIKRPFIANIKYKREHLEYKIKKMIDYIEQLQESVDRKSIAKTQTMQMINELTQLFNNDNKNHLFKTTNEMKNFLQGITPQG